MKLQIRMNLKKKCVEIRNSEHTTEKSALQKGADFLKIFMLGEYELNRYNICIFYFKDSISMML